MAKSINNHELKTLKNADMDSRPTMVSVDDVSMVFNMASEQLNNLKEYAIAIARRELRFKEFRALNHISIEIKKGDVFGILGTNGSGKSTLLKIIAGVLEPSEGSVVVNGNIAPLIELGAGFDMDLTARENIFLNGALLGYSKKIIEEKFDEIVQFAEIEEFLDIPIKNYSSGMMARIAFSIATVIVPDILVVDEVLSVGDFMFQRKCEDRIRQLIDEYGVTVLIVSHSNDQIERLCNRAIWIEKSKCRIIGSAEEVCRAYSGLGGRLGTQESEENIFEAINEIKEQEYPAFAFEDNAYAVAVELAKNVDLDTRAPETVIFTSCATHINAIYANTLSRHFNAPILPVTISDIPSEVIQYVYEIQPKRIIYIDCGKAGESVIPKIEKLPFVEEFIDLSGTGNVGLYSHIMFSFGVSNHIWTEKAAYLLNFEDDLEGLSLIPLLYEKGHPVIISRSSVHEGDIEETIQLALQSGIEQIIAVGSISNDQDVMKQCKGLGISKIAQEDTVEERCREIISIYNESREAQGIKSVCISSLSESQWISYIGIGRYTTLTDSLFYPIDLRNLDSISSCLEFIRTYKKEVENISIVGHNKEIPALYQLMFQSVLESDT